MENSEDMSSNELTGDEMSKKWWTDSSCWRTALVKKYRGDSFMWTVMTLPFDDIQRIMKDEQSRYRTFVHIWPYKSRREGRAFGDFAEAGFYYTGKVIITINYNNNLLSRDKEFTKD